MWYTANLLFKSVHSIAKENDDGMWEESFRLIEANSVEEATKKAAAIGKSSEVTYAGEGDDKVSWLFVQIERVYEIDADQLIDGSEIFSRYLRASEVSSILKPFED